MTERIVSKASRRELAEFLSRVQFGCEALSDILGTPFEKMGHAPETLLECIDKVALQGMFRKEHLDKIEKQRPGFREKFAEIAIAMEFVAPKHPMLDADDLKALKSLAERGRLYETSPFNQISVSLPDLVESASIAFDDRGQVLAWFDAANRQALRGGDKPWIVELVLRAAEQCAEASAKSELHRAYEYLSKEPRPWKLPAFGELPPAQETPPAARRPREPEAPPKRGFGLAIGIGRYMKYPPRPSDPDRGPRGFADLKCAAKDANDVTAFLLEQQDIDFKREGHIEPLVDEEATLRGILRGLEELRTQCVRSGERDPLVVVYFSGHGIPDSAGRHYLVPHDADPDELFSTALWNRLFNAALEQIPTQRLIVLLDACHAQAMAPPGAKDGASLLYDPHDPHEGLQLEAAGGRYFIASCEAGQRSYEGDGNGVFTESLLSLLRFEDLAQEQLDLADLYRHLRERVDQVARRLRQASQIPTANIPEGVATGIILAVNRSRELRLRNFHAHVSGYLHRDKMPQWATIDDLLKAFVVNELPPEEMRENEEFFALFTEAADRWQARQDERVIAKLCTALAKQPCVRVQRSAKLEQPGDELSTAPRRLKLGMASAASALTAQTAQELRTLAAADVVEVLAVIPKQTEYLATIARLKAFLSRAVSEQQFIDAVMQEPDRVRECAAQVAETAEEREEILAELQPRLEALMDELGFWFKKAWKAAAPAGPRGLSLVNLRARADG